MSVGCLEPAFFKAFIEGFVKAVPPGFTLDGWTPTPDVQFDLGEWPKLKEYLTKGFATQGRDYWARIFHSQCRNLRVTSFLHPLSQERMLVLFLF
jgi:alpha-methylacyl-CoA racemase